MTDYIPYGGVSNADTVRRLNGWLDDVAYRPGWQLEVRCASDGYTAFDDVLYLQVRAPVEDSYRPGCQVVVTHTHPVWPNIIDRDMFLSWLRETLHRVEAHESDEWLRWSTGPQRGLPVVDPHQKQR